QVMRIGSAWAAMSRPTMSSQWVTISVDANPWRLNAATRHGPIRSASGRTGLRLLAGVFHTTGASTTELMTTTGPHTAPEHKPPAEASAGGANFPAILGAARWVRPPPPQAAVARRRRRATGSLSGVAVGDHAAADHREGGRTLLYALPRALPHRRAAGGCVA